MKHKLLFTLLLASVPFNLVQANNKQSCVSLEFSNLARTPSSAIGGLGNYNFALSDDRRLIALYEHFRSKKIATFKLWDSQTGKLLEAKKLNNYEERSSQTDLHFSPDSSFVYLEGMTDGVPFWHLENNKVIFSPCETGMGITGMQFSDDLEVAYTLTIDSHHSLCKTRESKELAVINYARGEGFVFDSKIKHLFATHATTSLKEYKRHMKSIGQDNKHVTLYRSPIQEYPYHPTSNNTFATLFIGSPPNPRLLIAKTEGENLSLGLWHYEKNHRSPKKIYLHTIHIPELHSKKKPIATVYSSNLLMSPDKKQAIFLSKSGVLLLLDIQTGKVVWKKYLTTHNADTENYSFGGKSSTAVVIEQKKPQALLLFDWKTGKQQGIEKNTVLKTPSNDYKYDASKYIQLTHGHHRVNTVEQVSKNNKKEYAIKLHDIDKKRNRTLQTEDAFLHTQLEKSNKNSPELLTISYDRQKRQSKFCRLQLKHKH